jgi:hypothetical protein
MFSEEYTFKNNKFASQLDPLNLKRCLRLYPQDDNQGGFFVCVIEKTEDIKNGGDIIDHSYSKDAWTDSNVR